MHAGLRLASALLLAASAGTLHAQSAGRPKLYVANSTGDSIHVIDLKTLQGHRRDQDRPASAWRGGLGRRPPVLHLHRGRPHAARHRHGHRQGLADHQADQAAQPVRRHARRQVRRRADPRRRQRGPRGRGRGQGRQEPAGQGAAQLLQRRRATIACSSPRWATTKSTSSTSSRSSTRPRSPSAACPRPLAVTRDEKTLYCALSDLHGFVIADIPGRKVIAQGRAAELPPGREVAGAQHADARPGAVAQREGAVGDELRHRHDVRLRHRQPSRSSARSAWARGRTGSRSAPTARIAASATCSATTSPSSMSPNARRSPASRWACNRNAWWSRMCREWRATCA